MEDAGLLAGTGWSGVTLQSGLTIFHACARIPPDQAFGGRLMAGQGSLEPYIEVQILAPEPAGPLAQRQSDRLITGWSQVRILQGPLGRSLDGLSPAVAKGVNRGP